MKMTISNNKQQRRNGSSGRGIAKWAQGAEANPPTSAPPSFQHECPTGAFSLEQEAPFTVPPEIQKMTKVTIFFIFAKVTTLRTLF